MADENVYENVTAITGKNRADVKIREAPQRRSKVTVEIVVLAALLLAAVGVIIGLILYYNSAAFTTNAKPMTKMTTVKGPAGFTETPTTQGYTTKAVSTCSSVAQCDEDWELHGTKCFYFSPRSLRQSWNSSRETCQSHSGDLVKIQSREEQEFLDGKVPRMMQSALDKFWIGLTDSQTEGTWFWTDGSSLDQSLAFWTANEPDNWKVEDEDGENCAVIGETEFINKLNSWYDVSCKKNCRFICEKTATCG